MRTKILKGAGAALAVSALLLTQSAAASTAAGPGNWSQYLLGPTHSSFQRGQTAITPANAASIAPAWDAALFPDSRAGAPAPTWLASPTVYKGRIFIGANTGDFYAYDLATGARIWKTPLGFQTTHTCSGEGVVSTAAVAPDPANNRLMVYAAGGDGFLYAMSAKDGRIRWSTQIVDDGESQGVNAGMVWSSPLLIDGKLYIGFSSNCDNPLVRGGLSEVDQSTGAILATYYPVPDGSIGGGIWSSAATESGNSVFVTTGNGDPDDPNNQGDSVSIVRLNGTTLARTDIWTVPPPQLVQDSDFGGSPTLFTATIDGTPTKMVGACNKNSIYYAWNRNDLAAGPVWQDQIGTPHSPGGQSGLCLSAAAWDGTHLFESGPQTMIDDVTYRGSIREIDPATGSYLWETGLSGGILTSPALDGAGVLAVGSWDFVNPNEVWLLDASNGEVLTQIDLGTSQLFSQPVFAGNYLLVASRSAGLMAYATP